MSKITEYANSFQTHPRLGLERIQFILGYLGNPQKDLHCIHIAGTNGKGSVVMFLDSILRGNGYKVGRYMSPNLVTVNERIVVDGTPISDEDLERIFSKIEIAVEESKKVLGEAPSQFEIWTAAAFLYFQEQKCDYVVLEVGMGGAFDATNIIEKPVAPVFTKIDFDHMSFLGSTKEEIAKTKSGIIKNDSDLHTVFSVRQSPTVDAVLEQAAKEHNQKIVFVNPSEPKNHDGFYEIYDYDDIKDIHSGISGVHQIENGSLAIAIAKEMGIPTKIIKEGIRKANHPARLEVLNKNPLMIYDGGHNPNGITALKKSLDRYLGSDMKRTRTYIFACMKDKEIEESLRLLSQSSSEFIFTTVSNYSRALPAKELQEKAMGYGIVGEYRDTLADAIKLAFEKGNPTIICGSLYLYSDLPKQYMFAGEK